MPGVTYFIPSYSTRNRVVHLSLARILRGFGSSSGSCYCDESVMFLAA
jgi:hypothetical protein